MGSQTAKKDTPEKLERPLESAIQINNNSDENLEEINDENLICPITNTDQTIIDVLLFIVSHNDYSNRKFLHISSIFSKKSGPAFPGNNKA